MHEVVTFAGSAEWIMGGHEHALQQQWADCRAAEDGRMQKSWQVRSRTDWIA